MGAKTRRSSSGVANGDQTGSMKLRAAHRVPRSTSRRNLTFAGIALVAITIGIASLTVWDLRRDAVARAKQEVTNLGILLADQNARLFQATALVLQETGQMAAAAGVRTPEQFVNLMATERVHDYLVEEMRNLPQADAISLIDNTGKVVNFSRGWPVPAISTAGREYFQALAQEDKAGAFVGLPFKNSTNGSWDIPIGRRITNDQGEFLGIVNVMVEVRYFEDLYQRLVTKAGESIAIFRGDGPLLARYPHIENMMGARLPANAPWYKFAETGGTYHTIGGLDGIARIVSMHHLDNFPLLVSVSTSEAIELADWRRQSILIAVGAACSVIGLAVFVWALRAQFRRREDSESALARQNAELQNGRAVLERKTADLERSAEALRQSEGRFRDFALTSSDWFWETDANHRFIYLSENVQKLGTKPDQYLGKTRFESAGDLDKAPEKWREHLEILARHEPFQHFVYARKGSIGGADTASVSGNPLFDPSGKFIGYRGTARDITSQFQAERDLINAKEAAEAANLAKSQFLANISHELRTPLNAIIGFSEMMEQGLAGPIQPKHLEYTRAVLQSGRHLLDVINDILDLARADAGKFELYEEEGINIRDIIDACISLTKHRAEAAGLSLLSMIDSDFPLITADATRLKQILLNLVSNAVRFTKPGGSVAVSASVSVSIERSLSIEVRDTGVGMSAEEVKVALEPFGQVDARLSREHEGTGLGLPLARMLAELHGGSLRVESQKGQGTTVIVTLPALRGAAVARAAPITASPYKQRKHSIVLEERLQVLDAPMFRTNQFEATHKSKILSSMQDELEQPPQLCAPVSAPPRREWFVAEPKDVSTLLSRDDDNLRFLFQKWRSSFGQFDSTVIPFAASHQLLARLAIIGLKPRQEEPRFRFIGEGHRWVGDYLSLSLGERVENMPDKEYGEWINAGYKSVAQTGEPRYELITAMLQYSEVGKPRRLARFERLLLPWRTASKETFITSWSRVVSVKGT
jgi:PAS domain S-box-containing protein